MEILAFASFAVLVATWLVAPTKTIAPVEHSATAPAAAAA
jgi:hypothetical protein